MGRIDKTIRCSFSYFFEPTIVLSKLFSDPVVKVVPSLLFKVILLVSPGLKFI